MLLDPKIADKIDAIDLILVKNKMMDPTKEYKWSAKKTASVERKYRNFLKLIASGMTAVPNLDVDMVWHEHILRTRKYSEDCQRVFGRMIHHDPDMSSDDLHKAWEQTKQTYQAEFGETYSKK